MTLTPRNIAAKIVDVDRIENGVPVIKTLAKQIRRTDGRVDVVVTVPCMNIAAKSNR